MDTEKRTRIEEIIFCEGEALDRLKDADSLRWTAAKLYADEAAAGTTQSDIAAAVGKGQQHVSTMISVYRVSSMLYDHGSKESRTFDSWYHNIVKLRDRLIKEMHDKGESNRSIGKKLGIDEKTVRNAVRFEPEEVDDDEDRPGCELYLLPDLIKDYRKAADKMIGSRYARQNIKGNSVAKIRHELDKTESKFVRIEQGGQHAREAS